MTERPILFSGQMVRAILEGRKTQTRRVAKVNDVHCKPGFITPNAGWAPRRLAEHAAYCPYGVPGDRLWVRENGWQPKEPSLRELREGADTWPKYAYDADGIDAYSAEQYKEWGWKRRTSIHMPRKFCRLVLELTAVRVERLQEISEADALAECVKRHCDRFVAYDDDRETAMTAISSYRSLWDSINAKRGFGWSVNPWVWVLEFKQE